MERAKSASARAVRPAAASAAVLPSGSRPWSSGARRTNSDTGAATKNEATAKASHALRQPQASIAQVTAGVTAMPAKETPIAAIATAKPRRSTNHLASVTLTTRLPMRPAPAVSSTPFTTIQPTSVSVLPRSHSDAEQAKVPKSMKRRPPCRSTSAPMRKPTPAITNMPSERGMVYSARLQPSSSTIGAMKGPAT